MPIVEYKLNISETGVEYHPAYIKAHEFFEVLSKTYAGYVLPESDRNYWVPDSLTVLSEDALVDRCINGQVSRIRAPGEAPLTNEQMEQLVREWYRSFNV